jgi:hypothetical protein
MDRCAVGRNWFSQIGDVQPTRFSIIDWHFFHTFGLGKWFRKMDTELRCLGLEVFVPHLQIRV